MVLFACTPRAGRYNSVYLLPDDKDDTRRAAEAWSVKVNDILMQQQTEPLPDGTKCLSGPDFLAVAHQVTQKTTGRSGYEWLCLAGIAVEDLASSPREQLEKWLGGKLAELDTFMKDPKTNWDDKKGLYRQTERLTAWARELRQMPNACAHDVREEIRTEKASGKSATPSVGRLKRGGILVGLGVVILIVSAAICWVAMTAGGASRKNTSRLLAPLRLQDWEQYASQALGKRAAAQGKPKEVLHDSLRQLYDPAEATAQTAQDVEKTIEDILQRFEKDMGRPGTQPLEQLIKSGPPEDLRALFPNGSFDPMGLLEWPVDKRTFWEGVTPSQVNALLQTLIDTSNQANGWSIPEQEREDFGVARQFFGLWNKLAESSGRLPEPLELHWEMGARTFYLRQEGEKLEKTLQLLKELAKEAKEIAAPGERALHTRLSSARECVKSVVAVVGPNGTKLPNLLGHKQSSSVEGLAHIFKCAEQLLELGQKWAKWQEELDRNGKEQMDAHAPEKVLEEVRPSRPPQAPPGPQGRRPRAR